MTLMLVFSLANLFGVPISGAVMPIGIICFFVYRARTHNRHDTNALSMNHAGTQLKNSQNILWLTLPMIVSAVNFLISSNFLPAYIDYETQRVSGIVPVELSFITGLLFLVFALGEEIAWRGFFQHQLNKSLPFLPALLITSFLFTIGHYAPGNPAFILYGLFFTFINSCLYGLIYSKTNNLWLTASPHFLANMLELSLYLLI